MTNVIPFHQEQYRNLKVFHLGYVRRHLKGELPAFGDLDEVGR